MPADALDDAGSLMEHANLLTTYPSHPHPGGKGVAAPKPGAAARTKYLPWLRMSVFFCFLDASVVLATGLFLFASSAASTPAGPALYAALAVAPVLTVGVLNGRGLYGRFAVLLPVGVSRVASVWLQAFGLVFLTATAFAAVHALGGGEAIGPAAPVQASTPWMMFLLVGFAGLLLPRLVWSSIRRRHADRLVHGRVLVIGTGAVAERVVQRLGGPGGGFDVVAVLGTGETGARESLRGVPVAGGLPDLVEVAQREGVDIVVVALPWDRQTGIAEAVAEAVRLPVDVWVAPDPAADILLGRACRSIAGVPLVAVRHAPISGQGAVLKRVEDVVLASLLLLVFAPVLIAVAVAIKLESRGPVLFYQRRQGFNGRVFGLYKFRSMYADMADQAAARQTSRSDSRVTRVGAFIRRHSIDELPQLFNVLRGDMSIVGPRPHALGTRVEGKALAEAVGRYVERCRVKPGLTGWAQVNKWRGELDTLEKLEMRVRYDLDYIENWSPLLDMKILALTLRCVIRDKHAY